MGFSLSMSTSGTSVSALNYTTVTYAVYLNWDNSSSFFGFSSTASGSIVYNIGAGNVTIPISVSAPSSAGGSGSGSTLLSSGTLNISHNLTGGITSVTGSATYSNAYVGTLNASDYVGNLQQFDRRPATPASVTATVNADKTIGVSVASITDPGGNPTIATTYNVQYSMGGGAYTGTQSSSGTSFTFSGLTRGQTYIFRAYTTNAAGGPLGYATSSSVFLPSGGKRWDGSTWSPTATAKRWDGSTWTDIQTAKRWDGSAWVNLA